MSADRDALRAVLRPDEPLGPVASETLIKRAKESFLMLYEETNAVHASIDRDDPTFIVGRKGAGKTALLVGGAYTRNSGTVLLNSAEIYTEVERLRIRVTQSSGPLYADLLALIWVLLLNHAAMLGCVRGREAPASQARRGIRRYLSGYVKVDSADPAQLLTKVAGSIATSLLEPNDGRSIREVCDSLKNERGTYLEAKENLEELLHDQPRTARISVVVDNLEDLHVHIDSLHDTLRGLFRAAGSQDDFDKFAFNVRFAFPAELLRKLKNIAATPEKDFNKAVVISWSAQQLISLAGNRLRNYLDIYNPYAARTLGLPSQHDYADRDAAEKTLRKLLPAEIRTGLGAIEDPVAYILRHTQLLPRHIILILNSVFSRTIKRSDGIPIASEADIISGVRAAENVIVEGILSTYSNDYPYIGGGLDRMKNHITSVISCSDLHTAFNSAGASRSGVDWDQFLEAAMAIGAIGIVSDETSRYTVGEFSYTFLGPSSAVEGRDTVCVHPLFMYRFFDRRQMQKMAASSTLPVYPYGSDTNHRDLQL